MRTLRFIMIPVVLFLLRGLSHTETFATFNPAGMFLDSSRNMYGFWRNDILGTSSNGANVVGKVIRQYPTNSGILEVFTSTDSGRTFMNDPNLNPAPPLLRYPHCDFTGPDGEGFVCATETKNGGWAGAWTIRNVQYGAGVWYPPINVSTGRWVRIWATRLLNSNISLLCYSDTFPNSMAMVIDTLGNTIGPPVTIWDSTKGTADYRNSKLVYYSSHRTDWFAFPQNFNSPQIRTSTDNGLTWDTTQLIHIPLPFDSVVDFDSWQNVNRQDGTTGAVFVFKDTADWYNNIPGGAIQFGWDGGKTTIFSPGTYEQADFPVVGRKDDNTLVAIWMYAPRFNPASWDSGRTFWDLMGAVSTDGGLTWGTPQNLTTTPNFSECMPQMARYIGPNNLVHVTWGESHSQSQPTDTADIYWASFWSIISVLKTYNYYARWRIQGTQLVRDPPSDVEEANNGGPKFAAYELGPVVPNPVFGQRAVISYQLPIGDRATLAIYNNLGQKVRILVDRVLPAGRFTADWDGRNESGRKIPAGVYFIRFEARTFRATRKFVVLR